MEIRAEAVPPGERQVRKGYEELGSSGKRGQPLEGNNLFTPVFSNLPR